MDAKREYLKPYEGNDNYIFISYAHKDRARVIPVIENLIKKGYRVWFDEGIDPGTEWDENIAAHINKCDCMLAFLSRNYIDSENCKDELNYARKLDKRRLQIYLEETELPSGMDMRLNRIQAIYKYVYNESEFYAKLYDCDVLEPSFDKSLVQKTVPVENNTGSGNDAKAKSVPSKKQVNTNSEKFVFGLSKFVKQFSDSAFSATKSDDGFVYFSVLHTDYVSNPLPKKIMKLLENRGILTWFVSKDIKPGDRYSEVIPAAIKNSKVFVLFLTKKALMSDEVRTEVLVASQMKIPVVSIQIDDFPLLDDNWKYLLRRYQINHLTANSDDTEINAVVEQIEKLYRNQ